MPCATLPCVKNSTNNLKLKDALGGKTSRSNVMSCYQIFNKISYFSTNRFLGFVDKLGTAYQDPIIATGYGSMLATPVMRAAVEEKTKTGQQLSKQDALDVIHDCMKILYYRDARAHSKVSNVSCKCKMQLM